MAYPDEPEQAYSFTAFQQSQGDNAFPGTQLDTELAQIYDAFDAYLTFIKNIQRADGKLNNGLVTRDALAADVLVGLPAPTVWVAATLYLAGATVTTGGKLYLCAVEHTSSADFAVDLAAGDWLLIADFTAGLTVGPNSVATSSVQDGAITTSKLADGATTTAKLADGALTSAKAAVSFGAVPVGASIPYAGVTLPAGWLWEDGSAVSRTTYAALFEALTKTFSGLGSIGSTSLTLPANHDHIGLVGAVVESSGIPVGTTITNIVGVTATLSAAITGAVGIVRALPHGAGDGFLTFNLPDSRGVTLVGRDDLGGSSAGRISTVYAAGRALAKQAGAETHELTIAQLATHNHGVNENPHSHGVTDPGHGHGYDRPDPHFVMSGGSGSTLDTKTPVQTSNATTGITVNDAVTAISIDDQGSSEPHNNLQPLSVRNYIVFAGV